MVVVNENEAKHKMADSPWIVRAHGVSEARVPGVPCAGVLGAHVHGVLCERTNCSDPVVISKFLAKFKRWKGGDERNEQTTYLLTH